MSGAYSEPRTLGRGGWYVAEAALDLYTDESCEWWELTGAEAREGEQVVVDSRTWRDLCPKGATPPEGLFRWWRRVTWGDRPDVATHRWEWVEPPVDGTNRDVTVHRFAWRWPAWLELEGQSVVVDVESWERWERSDPGARVRSVARYVRDGGRHWLAWETFDVEREALDGIREAALSQGVRLVESPHFVYGRGFMKSWERPAYLAQLGAGLALSIERERMAWGVVDDAATFEKLATPAPRVFRPGTLRVIRPWPSEVVR